MTEKPAIQEEIKAAVRRYFQRLINEKDLAVCDEMLADTYIDHDAPAGATPGLRGTREFVAGFLEQYPNMRVEIEDLLAEGSQVAARIVWRGNQRDTGASFHQVGIVILRVNARGQFVERWSAYKALG